MVSQSEEAWVHLMHLIRTHPHPRLRHRAQAVLLVWEGHPVSEVARLFPTAAHCVRAWRDRFGAEGEAGLQDRPRRGRPPTLDADDCTFLQDALDRSPSEFGLPMTTGSLRD